MALRPTGSRIPPGVHRIGFGVAWCYLLVGTGGAVLIDTGLAGEIALVGRRLGRLGLEWNDIQAILLTHGHLDHAGNLFRIKELTGAPIYAHAMERRHIDGCYPYRGLARCCGAMESIGRMLLRYRACSTDVEIRDGQELPFWGGLRVVHLPGHTGGHCGFYSERQRVLFCGDLLACWWGRISKTPAILNSAPELLAGSFQRAAELGAETIIPSHGSVFRHTAMRQWYHRRYANKASGASAKPGGTLPPGRPS
jgi:glyoxylase-like metal-dependent hydrolase (beta-lactamase superfamily II)